MTTDNIKLAVECGAVEIGYIFGRRKFAIWAGDIEKFVKKIKEDEQAKIAKLKQELCDMTFAYNACSHLLDKINK
jgi:hypothetical protein